MATEASMEQIDILVVIDTEYIKKNYGKQGTRENPKGINHSSQYMIGYSPRGINSGQGTADLSFKANVGDLVSFRGTSIEQNSDDSVIVYGIKYWKGDQVFNRFISNSVERSGAVQPNNTTDSGLPAVNKSQNFLSLDSKIAKSGTENFYVYIALYTLSSNGNTQELYGYYYWDPQVTVQ